MAFDQISKRASHRLEEERLPLGTSLVVILLGSLAGWLLFLLLARGVLMV
jgi:hypothetical protein